MKWHSNGAQPSNNVFLNIIIMFLIYQPFPFLALLFKKNKKIKTDSSKYTKLALEGVRKRFYINWIIFIQLGVQLSSHGYSVFYFSDTLHLCFTNSRYQNTLVGTYHYFIGNKTWDEREIKCLI